MSLSNIISKKSVFLERLPKLFIGSVVQCGIDRDGFRGDFVQKWTEIDESSSTND